MKSRQRRLYLCALPACATAALWPSLAQARAGSMAWLLLGLGTAADRPYRSCSLSLRALDAAGALHALRYPVPPGWTGKTWPYRTPQGQGELLMLALPAGDYEIQDFELVQQTGQTQRLAKALHPLRLQLHLQEGQVRYIGHCEAHDQGEQIQPRDVLVLSDRRASVQRQWAAGADRPPQQQVFVAQLPDLAALQHPQLLHSLGDR